MDSSLGGSKTASIINPTVDDSKTASILDPTTDGSKTASIIDPTIDVEKKELNAVHQSAGAEKSNEFQRGISDAKWFLCCVGLYLGAFLYGMQFTGSLTERLLTNLAQASIPPLLQTSKLPFLRPLAKLRS
jgi:hypothetical protein